MIGLAGIGRVGLQPARPAGVFSPISLFSGGIPGGWYDAEDMSTLFQDSAGTTPVTAVEQPVGRWLDKSGRGNHATQSTTLSRPVWSARYNLLEYSEDLGNVYWNKDRVTVSGNAIATVSNSSFQGLDRELALTTGVSYRIRFSLRAGTVTQAQFWFGGGANVSTATTVISGPGSISAAGADNVNLSNLSATVETVYEIRWTEQIGTHGIKWYPGDWTSQTAGDSILMSFPDLRRTIDTFNAPAYQRVGNGSVGSADYDTTGFRHYLRFDGSDDSFGTASIDFSATDKVTVWAGVTKLSDVARGMLVELGNGITNRFSIEAPDAGLGNFVGLCGGTLQASISVAGVAPAMRVLTLQNDIAADNLNLRVNGNSNISTGDQGTGTHANAPLFIGRRNNSSLPFNGRIYGLIVRGAQSSAGEIAATEAWLNQRTGAY